MARGKELKKYMFLVFLAACVVLIGVIWLNGITENQGSQPGYYRNTVPADVLMDLTLTAESRPAGTAQPDGEHEGRSGSGQGNHLLTPSPTIDWEVMEEDQ